MASLLAVALRRRFLTRTEHSLLCDPDMRRLVIINSVRGSAAWMRIDEESRRLQPRVDVRRNPYVKR